MRYVSFAALGAFGAAAFLAPILSPAELVVQLQRPVGPAPLDGSKLAPQLQAAVALRPHFRGVTRDGDPVLREPADMDPGRMTTLLSNTVSGFHSVVRPEARPMDTVNELIVLYGENQPLADAAAPQGVQVQQAIPSLSAVVVRAEDGFSPEQIEQLAAPDAVTYVEPNLVYRLSQQAPNDTHLNKLWGIRNARIDQAWRSSTVSNRVVAVIDSGVDLGHPDLAANLWTNDDETPNDGVDNDGNGYVDDHRGYDFHDNDPDPSGLTHRGHGTHVAGTIGAVGNNSLGVAGVCWDVQIMPIRIFGAARPNDDETASASRIARAVHYAVDNGAHVLNNSWGGPYSRTIERAFRRAAAAGTLVVAAAGNSGQDNDDALVSVYPAEYAFDNIIAVAAITEADALAGFSNHGRTTVDLAAPGVAIYSTAPTALFAEGFRYDEGTSMATPHVAGAAALLWSMPRYAGLSAVDLKQLILDNARSLPALQGRCATGGTLDLAFVDTSGPLAMPTPPAPTPPADPMDSGAATPVNIHGVLRSDFEVGAETTGTVIEPNAPVANVPAGAKIEVQPLTAEQKALLDRLRAASGEVVLQGQLRVREGVEVDQRHIVTVETVQPAE